MHINIRSLELNCDKVNALLYGMDSKPDIIAVSETRVNISNIGTSNTKHTQDGDISDSRIHINGYKFFYDDAPPNGTPGGAGVYIRDDLTFQKREDLKLRNVNSEDVWFETHINGKLYVIAVVYRHPRQNIPPFNLNSSAKLSR